MSIEWDFELILDGEPSVKAAHVSRAEQVTRTRQKKQRVSKNGWRGRPKTP